MQLINSILYLTWTELEALNVPFNTIFMGTKRNRSGKGTGWENMADPADGRKNLVRYDSIPAQTVKACGLESVGVMEKRYAEAMKRNGKAAILALLPAPLEGDVQYLQRYKVMREVLVNPMYGEVGEQDLGGLPESKVSEYLQVSRWLNLMLLPIWQRRNDRLKYTGERNIQDAMLFLLNTGRELGVKLPGTYKQLSQKLQDYQTRGIDSLIHKSYGNRNAEKINEVAEALIVKMASHRQKPSTYTVFENWQKAVIKQPTLLRDVSYTTIKRVLAKPVNKQVSVLFKDGKNALNDQFLHTMKGKLPSCSDAIYYVDGTKHNIAYQGQSKKGFLTAQSQLKMMLVVDGYSGAFVGWYISESENEKDVAMAVRHAISRSGKMPHQMMSDNAGPNQAFFKKYTGHHFHCMPDHGQSKLIERKIGEFQDGVLRGYPSYTGGNITAKSARSRVNSVRTKFDIENGLALKYDELPTKAEAWKIGEEAIRIWNHSVPKGGKMTRWEKYLQGQKEGVGRAINESDELAMFYQFRTQTAIYAKGGITIQNKNEKCTYEVYSRFENGIAIPDLDFHVQYVGQALWVKEDVSDKVGKIALYLEDSKHDKRFIGWAHPKVEIERAQFDYTALTGKQLDVNLKAKEEHIRMLETRQSSNDRVANELGVKIQYHDKEAQNLAEEELYRELYGWEEVSEDPELVPVPVAQIREQAKALKPTVSDKQRMDALDRMLREQY